MRMSSRPVRSPSIEASPCRERSTSPSGGTGACSLNSSVPASAHSDIWRPIEPLWKRCHAWRSRPVRTTSATTCRAQKLVMQQPDKYRVTRRAQVPKRSFDKLAAAETSPRRMELLGPAGGVVASDCTTKLESAHGTDFRELLCPWHPWTGRSRVGRKAGWRRLSLWRARPTAGDSSLDVRSVSMRQGACCGRCPCQLSPTSSCPVGIGARRRGSPQLCC